MEMFPHYVGKQIITATLFCKIKWKITKIDEEKEIRLMRYQNILLTRTFKDASKMHFLASNAFIFRVRLKDTLPVTPCTFKAFFWNGFSPSKIDGVLWGGGGSGDVVDGVIV
jgi:hypothetical protein